MELDQLNCSLRPLCQRASRYSTERQTEASIADQQRRCHLYAQARGWQVTADFADEGISGAALGNRSGFQRVMATLQGGDVLLAADLTRLSRSQELAPLPDRLWFRGIRVVGVLDGFDSDSPKARMQAGFSGLMSDELRAGIRARTHSALRANNGCPTGGKVYGYDPAGKVIDPEAVIVREIFERTAAGESMRAIANDLNARGIPSPGAGWNRNKRRNGRELLAPEAVERASQLTSKWAREESAQIIAGASPAIDSIAAEIADLEALIEARPARAATLRPLIEDLRARQAELQRSARQEAQNKLASKIPAEEGYRVAVAEKAALLQGANIEAARAALRSLIGTIAVFENAGQLYGRIGLNPMPLFQPRNPQAFGGLVAGA